MFLLEGLYVDKEYFKYSFYRDYKNEGVRPISLSLDVGLTPTVLNPYLALRDTESGERYLIGTYYYSSGAYVVKSPHVLKGLEDFEVNESFVAVPGGIINVLEWSNTSVEDRESKSNEVKDIFKQKIASKEHIYFLNSCVLSSLHFKALSNSAKRVISFTYFHYIVELENLYSLYKLEDICNFPLLANLTKDEICNYMDHFKYMYFVDLSGFRILQQGDTYYNVVTKRKRSYALDDFIGEFKLENRLYSLDEVKQFKNYVKSYDLYEDLKQGKIDKVLDSYLGHFDVICNAYDENTDAVDKVLQLLLESDKVVKFLSIARDCYSRLSDDASSSIRNLYNSGYLLRVYIETKRVYDIRVQTLADLVTFCGSVADAIPYVDRAVTFTRRIQQQILEAGGSMYNHDVGLLTSTLSSIIRSKKMNYRLLDSLLLYENATLLNLNGIQKVLNSLKPSSIDEALSILSIKLRNNEDIKLSDFEGFLRANSESKTYQHALEVCNRYAPLDLDTLKQGVTLKRLKMMENNELVNVLLPRKVTGSELLPKVLDETISYLLGRGGDSKPTAEQKKLYFLTKNVDFYNIQEEELVPILEQVRRIDKQKADLLRKLPQYTFEVLDKNDFRNIIIGDATQCCMNAGTSKQKAYTSAPCFNQCIITNEKEDKIVVSSVLWVDMQNYLVLDNIEAVQNTTLNNLIYRTIFSEILSPYCEDNGLCGYVQGAYHNDVKLYPDDVNSVSQLVYAKGTDNVAYQGFYSDASQVYDTFVNPLTGEQYETQRITFKSISSFR